MDDLSHFNVKRVYRDGKLAAENGRALDFAATVIEPRLIERSHNTFHLEKLSAGDFALTKPRPVLGIVENEITTRDCGTADGISTENDILKLAVVERHHNTGHIGIGYLTGYGLREGAVATSVSHDSHNIIAVGADDSDLAAAVNRIRELQGGMVVVKDGKVLAEVPLAVAGIMSEEPLETVNDRLEAAKAEAFRLGVSPAIDPFMTLGFMALPVIPTLRVTTKGVFDVLKQKYV